VQSHSAFSARFNPIDRILGKPILSSLNVAGEFFLRNGSASSEKLGVQKERALALDGYDVAFTRRRSPVRIRPSRSFVFRERDAAKEKKR